MTAGHADSAASLLRLSDRGAAAPDQPISRLMAEALANPHLISLAAGFVDPATLPVGAVRQASLTLTDDPAAAAVALQYGENAGDWRLRQLIADRYFADSSGCTADSMVLTGGSNELLHLICECMLDAGDIVLCAAPTYFVFLGIVRDVAARAVGVDTDRYGMLPTALDATLQRISDAGQRHRVKLAYLVPSYDNPAGTLMPESRRREILDVLQRWQPSGAIGLLADNAYHDLVYEGSPPPLFRALGDVSAWTIETGTFSKNFAPGVRVGWGVLPDPLYDAVCRRKAVIDFGSAHLDQRLLATVIAQGQLDHHLTGLRAAYRSKRDAMVGACQAHLAPIDPQIRFDIPAGGLYVWLRLPAGVDAGVDGPLWRAAVGAGVLYVPGEHCFATEGTPAQANCMRLSFGVQSAERITEGIRLLAEAVRSVL